MMPKNWTLFDMMPSRSRPQPLGSAVAAKQPPQTGGGLRPAPGYQPTGQGQGIPYGPDARRPSRLSGPAGAKPGGRGVKMPTFVFNIGGGQG